jgi:hypothetical protein
MVSVAGVSLEHIQPDVLANLQDSVVHQNPQNVPGNGDSPDLSRYQFSGNSWSVSGDLTLNNAILLVQGDLNVSGSIKGFGSVIVTGNINAAGAQLQAAGKFALAAGGSINLP